MERAKWQRCWSSSRNAPYWYNTETNESVWTEPDIEQQSGSDIQGDCKSSSAENNSWIEKYSATHQAPYWYNTGTGASVWSRPEGINDEAENPLTSTRKRKADKISAVSSSAPAPAQSGVESWYRQLTNPPVHVTLHSDPSLPHKTFKLIDDGYCCIGGTKQRLLGTWLRSVPQHEIVYAGPDGGMAQVAMAFTAAIWRKKAVVFLNASKDAMKHPFVRLAHALGADVRLSDTRWTLQEAQAEAEKYVNMSPSTRMAVPFGLRCERGHPVFETFREALVEAISATLPIDKPPNRLWIVAGSGFILDVLHSIWPTTEFLIVQVGKKVWREVLEGKKHKLYVALQRFSDMADIQPTYPSVPWYDAKLWQFVVKFGQDGDYIWNVARVPDDAAAAGREALALIEKYRVGGGGGERSTASTS